MNNPIQCLFRFYASLFLLMGSIVLQGQNLYRDALDVVKATRENKTYLEIYSDANVQLMVTKMAAQADLPPVIRTIETPNPLVMALDNNTSYDLTAVSGQEIRFRLWQGNDTFPQEGALRGGDLGTVIDNRSGYAEISIDLEPQIWVKQQFLKLHSALAFYEPKLSPYNINMTFQRLQDHPYLGPVVRSEAFSPGTTDGDILDQLVSGIEADLALRKARRRPSGLDLLRRDSVISTENLLSIINVQREYQVPAIENPDALTGIAEKAKSAQLGTGAADFSATLIAGLSDFVVARAQDEFNVSFMNRFQAKLASVPELKVLFPQSAGFLDGVDITNYRSLLVSAREAFHADVKNLGLNFTGLFKLDGYESLRNDPVIYNLLTVYQMTELIYRGLPLDTILPLTFNQILLRQKELNKEINLSLASSLQSKSPAELAVLAESMQILEDSLKAVWLDLSKFEQRFYFDIARVIGGLTPEEKQDLVQVFLQAEQKLEPLRLELSNSLDTLQIIPSNLRGSLNYDRVMDQARLEDFDKYFESLPDPLELIGAGLELTRHQVKGVDGKPNKAELLMACILVLKEAQGKYQAIVREMARDPLSELEQENRALVQRRAQLMASVSQETAFRKAQNVAMHELKALEFIYRSIAPGKEFQTFYNEGRQPSDLLDTLQSLRQLLAGAESLLQTQLDLLQSRYPDAGRSPLAAYFDPEITPAPAPPPTPLDRLQARAFDLISRSGAIARKMEELDDRYCSHLLQARSHTEVFGGILELSSYLVNAFCTEKQEDGKWISPVEFNALMGDSYQRKVFLGLVHQNLSEIRIFRDFSSEGVASLVSGFINTLGAVSAQVDTLKALRQGKQRPLLRDYFPLIEATVSMVNQVLETPLVVRPDSQGNKINAPFTSLYPDALKNIPDISRELLGLFENVSYDNYRFAIDNAVNLFDLLSQRNLAGCLDTTRQMTSTERKACKIRVETIQHIVKYGNFISDIAMAQQPEDIKQALLNVDLAGKSSQTKREDLLNLSLNGYFGGAFAREYPNPADAADFNVGSLSVPIGLTLSFKAGAKDPGSFSLFLPVIDIGAVTSFRLEGEDGRYPELTLSNFIAPGVFLYRNMKNSPFYFGLGYQYGPNIREITVNGVAEKVSSSRFVFLNFGIDVPFFSLARVRE